MKDSNQIPPASGPSRASGETAAGSGLEFREYQELKNGIHRYLLNQIDLEKVIASPDDATRAQVLVVIQNLIAHLKVPLVGEEKERLTREILDEVFGLGPLEPLFKDATISDI